STRRNPRLAALPAPGGNRGRAGAGSTHGRGNQETGRTLLVTMREHRGNWKRTSRTRKLSELRQPPLGRLLRITHRIQQLPGDGKRDRMPVKLQPGDDARLARDQNATLGHVSA